VPEPPDKITGIRVIEARFCYEWLGRRVEMHLLAGPEAGDIGKCSERMS
jgi:hypothetical protein